MLQAAIDLGTNTCLLLIAETERAAGAGGRTQKILRTVSDELGYVRLGQGVHANRAFAPEAMERALKCLHDYRKICDAQGVKPENILAVATSASRDAKNSAEFYARVQKETGIRFKIIPGEVEAKVTFLGGILEFQDPAKAAVLDIGGGSTEFVTRQPNGELHGQSIDMGSVRATELFLKGDPYTRGSLEDLERALRQAWKDLEAGDLALAKELRAKEWTAVAGTPTTMAAINLKLPKFTSERVDGYRLDRCEVADFYEAMAVQTQEQRKAIPLLGTGRADVMCAGAAILLTAMETFDKSEVIVSSRGIRHGTLLCPELIQG